MIYLTLTRSAEGDSGAGGAGDGECAEGGERSRGGESGGDVVHIGHHSKS